MRWTDGFGVPVDAAISFNVAPEGRLPLAVDRALQVLTLLLVLASAHTEEVPCARRSTRP